VWGPFAPHGLKARLPAEALALWHTAVQYHLWHALALVLVGLCASILPESAWLRAAGWLLLAGIALFSGSVYALALGAPKWLGAIAPLGGTALVLGWFALALAAARA
jgi:uncharacterized membrane protein YgdD (TMEM256/DUF423 family)